MKIVVPALAALLLSAMPAAAQYQDTQDQDYGPPPYAMGGQTYNFYGPSTNYFGPPPMSAGYGDAGYGDAGYGAAPAGYDGPPPYSYGGPGYGDDGPPPDAYDDMRLDPWHGYSPVY